MPAFVVLSASADCPWAQDKPQWRGPNRDGKVSGFTAPPPAMADEPGAEMENARRQGLHAGRVGAFSPASMPPRAMSFGASSPPTIIWAFGTGPGPPCRPC
jgi:hypothetical protein